MTDLPELVDLRPAPLACRGFIVTSLMTGFSLAITAGGPSYRPDDAAAAWNRAIDWFKRYGVASKGPA
jgi:dienelactone hydrolase